MQRAEPDILRLLPPQRNPIAWGYIGLFVLVMVVTAIQFGRVDPQLATVGEILFGGLALGAITFALLQRRSYGKLDRKRAEYVNRYPSTEDLPWLWNAVHEVCASSPFPFARPQPLGKEFACNDRASIICAGLIDVPEATEERFEPMIFTPTRHQLENITLLAVMLLGSVWITWQICTGRIPMIGTNVIRIIFGALGLGGFIVAAAYALVIRSTYVRLAPGVVQFVSFDLFKRRPVIRSYPMEAGTIAVVGQFGRCGQVFLISRGDQADRIPLSWMLGRRQAVDSLWRAMLSTAPTPPLSEDSLLG